MLAIATQDKTLKFWISGKVIPKARPRFYNGHAILPSNYRSRKNTAYLEIISQRQQIQYYRAAHRESSSRNSVIRQT